MRAAGIGLAAAVLVAIAGWSHGAGAAPEPAAVTGRWITAGRDGVFEIGPCGGADRTLCGRLVGMRYHGSMPLDVWKRPQCGLQLLSGFRPGDEPGRWAGKILDPDNGRSYQANIWSPSAGVLDLRGYWLVPMLGETQSWTRFSGSIGAACRIKG